MNIILESVSGSAGYSGPEFIPEKVFDKRTSENGGTEYLVMWKGFFFKDGVRSKYPRSWITTYCHLCTAFLGL
jgi:hypothetical protein